MKCLRLAVIFVFSITLVRAEEDKGLHSIWTAMSQIEGTRLIRSDQATSPEGSNETTRCCSIGYYRGDSELFVSILTLPILENDEYVTVVTDGVLKISTKSEGKMVLNLDLRNFQPMALE